MTEKSVLHLQIGGSVCTFGMGIMILTLSFLFCFSSFSPPFEWCGDGGSNNNGSSSGSSEISKREN